MRTLGWVGLALVFWLLFGPDIIRGYQATAPEELPERASLATMAILLWVYLPLLAWKTVQRFGRKGEPRSLAPANGAHR